MYLVILKEKEAGSCSCSSYEYEEFDCILYSKKKYDVEKLKQTYCKDRDLVNNQYHYLMYPTRRLTPHERSRKPFYKQMYYDHLTFKQYLITQKKFTIFTKYERTTVV